jgi:uncharacterized membrane protein YgcG
MPLLQCTACGFHVSDVQQLLGAGSVRVERLIDHAGCLSLRDSHYLNLALDDFERRFPQVFISVFLGSLPANVNAPQAAFWLLNHGTAIRNDQAKPGHWGIVLVLDLAQKQAGMAFGYSLEALLNLQTQNALLQDALPHFAHGEHRRGVLSVLTDLDKQLMRKGQSHRRAPASSDNADQSHLGLEQVHPATRPPTRLAGTLPPRR